MTPISTDIYVDSGVYVSEDAKKKFSGGLDVNLKELKQAAAAFGSVNINWVFGDLETAGIGTDLLDLAVFNASLAYFPERRSALENCMKQLKDGGEIHILDTPVYRNVEQKAARTRSEQYFEKAGAPQMKQFYHPVCYDELNEWYTDMLYDPGKWYHKIPFVSRSPFHWFRIMKNSSSFHKS